MKNLRNALFLSVAVLMKRPGSVEDDRLERNQVTPPTQHQGGQLAAFFREHSRIDRGFKSA
ncbi:hypothetical protein QNZ27_004271 [Escherichia coli]|nr:hypothetical protein [Escherichia coli]